MKMYIANASPQEHIFIYRIPEQHKQRQLTIRRGGQIAIPDDLNQEQINSIVSQHEKYGFVSAADVRTGKVTKNFTRLIYSIGSPVSGLTIEALVHGNRGVLDQFGKQIRQETAIAANKNILDELQKEREASNLEADVGGVDITIQEEEPRGGYDRPSSEIVAEGFKMSDHAQKESAPVHKAKGRRK